MDIEKTKEQIEIEAKEKVMGYFEESVVLFEEIKKLKIELENKKINSIVSIFNLGKYGKIKSKFDSIKKDFFTVEKHGIILLELLRKDFSKSKTMGNIMANLNDSLPPMINESQKLEMLRFSVHEISNQLNDIKNQGYALLAIFISILGLIISLI